MKSMKKVHNYLVDTKMKMIGKRVLGPIKIFSRVIKVLPVTKEGKKIGYR